MKNLKPIIIAAAILAAVPAFAEVPLKVLRGVRDTVYTRNLDAIFQTSPQATAAVVAGEKVQIYKTGAFGRMVELAEGDNTIDVSVTVGGETLEKTFNVFCTKRPPRPEPRFTLEEAERILDKESFHEMDAYGLTKENTYLQYGDGSDRLGGSKMGYLVAGIPVKIVGQLGGLFKLQLSENRWAYVDRGDIEPSFIKTGVFNTMNASIYNVGKTDQVIIPLPQRLPYASWTELDPTTIYVDVFGATNNSNWIIHRRDLEMIDWVDIRQVESDVVRVVIKLKEKFSWGYSIDYRKNSLVINVKHAPKPTLKGMTIGLDAGHGGAQPGAVGATGLQEKDVNLNLVMLVKGMLEAKGAKVVLSRDSDKTMTMTERKKILLDGDIDLLVSIHNNAGGSPFVPMGTSTYYKSIANRELAASLIDNILTLGVGNYGLTGNFNFSLCAPTEYPCALVEGMFMSSLPDEEKLSDPAFLKQLASKVVAGIEDYLSKVKASQKK